jgi:hypothetical protein
MNQTEAGWYTDPQGRHTHRYWDGTEWTDNVADNGVTSTSPLSDANRTIPPAPESHEPMPPPPAVSVTQSSGSSAFGVILATILVLIAIGVLFYVFLIAGDADSSTTTVPQTETTQPAEVTTTAGVTTTGG